MREKQNESVPKGPWSSLRAKGRGGLSWVAVYSFEGFGFICGPPDRFIGS